MVNILSSLCCNTVLIYTLLNHEIKTTFKTGKMGCVCVVECSLYAHC
jgi:hypothetical protein